MKKNRIMLGPFSEVYRESNTLKFAVPASFRVRVVEPALREGLKISREKILRAYRDRYGRYWILVEFEKGYDLYKHFKLSPRDRYARRIPRIVVETCPKCGENLVDEWCLECGGEVERPKYVEVLGDPETVETISGSVEKVDKTSSTCFSR